MSSTQTRSFLHEQYLCAQRCMHVGPKVVTLVVFVLAIALGMLAPTSPAWADDGHDNATSSDGDHTASQSSSSGALYLGYALASLSWTNSSSFPFYKYSCSADTTISNTSFDSDYYGNVTVKVDWEANAAFFSPFGGEFDAYFKWYVDNVEKKNANASCSDDCKKSGSMELVMTSPGGTKTYQVKLYAEVDSDEKDCSYSETKTVSIVRPPCDTTLDLDTIQNKTQNDTQVTISGTVSDICCYAAVNDNKSVTIKLTGPDGTIHCHIVNGFDVVNGAFSHTCNIINPDDASSYGQFKAEATYTPQSPAHPLIGSSDSQNFDRYYALQVPTMPVGVTKSIGDPIIGDKVLITDSEDGQIYGFDWDESVPSYQAGMGGIYSGSPRGLQAVSNFLDPGGRDLLAVTDGNNRKIRFSDLAGNPVFFGKSGEQPDDPTFEYNAPTLHPWGLAFDGTWLWVACNDPGEAIYKLELSTGSQQGVIHPSIGRITDISWDDDTNTLLALSGNYPNLYRINPNTGAILQEMPLNSSDHQSVIYHKGGIYVGDHYTKDFYLYGQTTGHPGIPKHVQAASGPATPESIHITWTDPDQGPPWDLIRIYHEGSVLDTVEPGIQEYWHEGLEEHSYHEYYLTAYRTEDDVEGEPSETAGTYAGSRPPIVINVPDDYESIQLAIYQAMDGDTILVQPGTYDGPITFAGQNVTVTSANGPRDTIIDGDGFPLNLIRFDSTEGAGAVLSGFTLTGCNLHSGSGVIHCGPDASPTIENNLIVGNTLRASGGGIVCEGGGAGTPLIQNNTIAFNAMHMDIYGTFLGGGIYCIDASPIITANIIAFNTDGGHGLYCAGMGALPSISCNDLWFNYSGGYYGCDPGTGDIAMDPLFCDAGVGDYRLCADSPCIDGFGCGQIGALGQGCQACGPTPDTYTFDQDLTGVFESDAQWGDFDGDGDLDLVICGESDTGRVTLTYENQSGTLVLFPQVDLPGIQSTGSGCLAWGDYDGDGDLDLAMAGMSDAGSIARIYENDGSGNLTWDTQQVLTGLSPAALAWGDYDNDGDLDLVVVGGTGEPGTGLSTLYVNDPQGTLTADPGTTLTGLYSGSADWADYDNDGDLDLLLTGSDGSQSRTIFYENNPVGTLTDDGNHGLPGVALSDAAWGDYDNDGDLDLAITGSTGMGAQTFKIYENAGSGVFSQVANPVNIYRSSCAWGDYDNDGDLDLALCGYTGTSLMTRIYENTASGFSQVFTFTSVREGSVSFADVDSDGDLDFFMTGADWSTKYARLYEKGGGVANNPPMAPTYLNCESTAGGLEISWTGASGGETPADSLYYCLRVGTSPGANDVVSGTYGTPLMGNVGQCNSLLLDVPQNTYYCSVRAIDAGLAASPWSTEAATSPILIGAVSRRAQGTPGDLDIELPLDPPNTAGVECRDTGPAEVILAFSEPIKAIDDVPDETEVNLSAGELGIVTINDREMTIQMSGVPDLTCLVITLSGISDLVGNPMVGDDNVHLVVLRSDVSSDYMVTAIDFGIVKSEVFQSVTNDNASYDVNADGLINAIDLGFIKADLWHTASCP